MKYFSSYRALEVKLLTLNAKNCYKSAIFSAIMIIELVQELVISNMHNRFGKEKLFKLLRPQVNVNAAAAKL